ncbi:UNVERIFIED_CONTAM: hypothetical protein Slati_3417200 [Sesamum latifolium]|uniref:Reverse transcriptase domain-containing protein n=1 Tax=Sesamum latifolium TaxID=2727402 RepID=A0AAW2UGF9_9LAMI
MMGKVEANDPPRKGVIRMIAYGLAGGDSQRARKAQEERSGPKIPGNDALVIIALLANFEIERVFIDSGSLTDILFGEAYDQMQLGDIPLEAVDTSLYGFAGEVVHPRGMISLPLTLGTSPLRKICLLKFLVVDTPSAYNVILGRPTLNAFRAITSTYHMKIKFPVIGGVGEAHADELQARKCYVEAIKRGKKRILEEASGEENSNKRGKDSMPRLKTKEEAPAQFNQWRNSSLLSSYQHLEGIDPGVITHHLNLHPTMRPVKQKKRHFRPEKDKIIQREVNKLLTAGHIRKIQFLEWLSNVVLVPKPGGKWRMCVDFRDLNKACPKDYHPLPRIDQLVDTTSGGELLSMMDASHGYHRIMLAPEDIKGSASSHRTAYFATWPCHSG